MKYAFNTKAKAVAFITRFNSNNTNWTAKLNIGKAVGHTSLDLYANSQYAGTLQGDILGSALYKQKNENGLQGTAINLTWKMVLDGVDEVYQHPTSWGTWFCHDITAAVFRRWGFNGQAIYRAAYPHTPFGRVGLVVARLGGLVLVPGTTVVLVGHEGWNAFQDGWNSLSRASEDAWNKIKNFRLW
jgi:hypothetical protein